MVESGLWVWRTKVSWIFFTEGALEEKKKREGCVGVMLTTRAKL